MAKKPFNTGKFPEKVFALATYDGTLLQQTYQNPINKKKINIGAAFIIKNYFDAYMDSKARASTKSFHHIYEFGMTGQKDGRLFKAGVVDSPSGAVLSYSFTTAKVPNDNGYPFPQKALVMETGEPLIIKPKSKQYLKYRLDDGQFITSKESFVPEPGGPVKNNFQDEFNSFMRTQITLTLRKFKFYETIERAIIEKRRLMIPRINSGALVDAAARGTVDAAQIAHGVSGRYV